MCNKNSEIHLCTCNSIDKKKFFIRNDKNCPTLIKWTLYRLIKEEWIGMDGMVMEPVKEFSTIITDQYLKDELNKRNCFDFEYNPNEGDTIIFNLITYTKSGRKIKKGYPFENTYISLIYKDKQWVISVYDPFYIAIEEVKKGYLKQNSNRF